MFEMIRADLNRKMRGYGVRPQDRTFFRKRITALLEFGTFAVIVCIAWAAAFAVLRFLCSVCSSFIWSSKPFVWALPASCTPLKRHRTGFGYPQLQCHFYSRQTVSPYLKFPGVTT